MRNTTPPNEINPLYRRLHDAVKASRKRQRVLLIASIAGVGMFFVVMTTPSSLFAGIALYIFAVFMGFLSFIIVVMVELAMDQVNRDAAEEKQIRLVLSALTQYSATSVELEAVDKHAEIGVNVGQLRTLFPLLLLPIGIPLAIQILSVLVETHAPVTFASIVYLIAGFLFLVGVTFSLFNELDRANADAIIRHALVEYQRRRRTRPLPEARRLLEEQQSDEARRLLRRYLPAQRSH